MRSEPVPHAQMVAIRDRYTQLNRPQYEAGFLGLHLMLCLPPWETR